MNKKGFLFSFITFIFLFFFLISFIVAINSLTISEVKNIKQSKLKSFENQISFKDDKFKQIFEAKGYYALYKINNHSINNYLKYNDEDELFYLKNTFFDLILNGSSANFEKQELIYSNYEVATYTFKGFSQKMNKTLNHSNLFLSKFNIKNYNFSQLTPVVFQANITLEIEIKNREETFTWYKEINLSQNFSIQGFIDPLVTREYKKIPGKENIDLQRQIFYIEKKPSDFKPKIIFNSSIGQGFFYGPVVNVSEANTVDNNDKPYFILVGDFSQIKNVNNWELFGAFILTNKPTYYENEDCPLSEKDTFNAIVYYKPAKNASCVRVIEEITQKPYLVVENFSFTNLRGPNGEKHVLILAKYAWNNVNTPENAHLKYEGGKVLDIEDIRDMIACSYYVNSPNSPSYPQRLSKDPLNKESKFGITTFLVGEWAGGANLTSYNEFSRRDVEFFKRESGIKIRGLAGCKFVEMCNLEAGENSPLGQFRLTLFSIKEFNLNEISCNNNMASCEIK